MGGMGVMGREGVVVERKAMMMRTSRSLWKLFPRRGAPREDEANNVTQRVFRVRLADGTIEPFLAEDRKDPLTQMAAEDNPFLSAVITRWRQDHPPPVHPSDVESRSRKRRKK